MMFSLSVRMIFHKQVCTDPSPQPPPRHTTNTRNPLPQHKSREELGASVSAAGTIG